MQTFWGARAMGHIRYFTTSQRFLTYTLQSYFYLQRKAPNRPQSGPCSACCALWPWVLGLNFQMTTSHLTEAKFSLLWNGKRGSWGPFKSPHPFSRELDTGKKRIKLPFPRLCSGTNRVLISTCTCFVPESRQWEPSARSKAINSVNLLLLMQPGVHF